MEKAGGEDIIYCVICGGIKNDKYCDNCEEETANLKKVFISDRVIPEVSLGIKAKSPGAKRPIFESWDRHKKSNDPRIKKGVKEIRVIDRRKNSYYHQVIDKNTGKIIHEERELLSRHKNKATNDLG